MNGIDKAIPQGADGNLDKAQTDWLRLMPDGWNGGRMSMCYLCDLCRHNGGSFGGGEIECTSNAGAHVTGHVQEKLVIDYGKQDPLEICKHFEREVVDK